MSIYSTDIGNIAQVVAQKKLAAKPRAQPAATTSLPKKRKGQDQEPPTTPHIVSDEEARRIHRNALAKERRARAKQEKLDKEAGVTLATHATTQPIKDPQPHITPAKKEAVAAKKRKVTPVPSQEEEEEEEEEFETLLAEEVLADAAAAAAAATTPPAPPAAKTTPGAPKKTKTVKAFTDDEPPKWYTSLLTEIVRLKTDEAGEKASKKIIKETGDELAKERWADPVQREKARAGQDKLYNQMFGRRAFV